jgi:uncharacterized protein (DUF58 family)
MITILSRIRFWRSWRVWAGHIAGADVDIVWRRRELLPVLLSLLLLELAFPSRVWAGLLIVAGGMLTTAAWWVYHQTTTVRVRRDLLYAWVQVGDHLEERFVLTNAGLVPLLWVEVVDHSNLPGYSASTVRAAGSGETVRWYVLGTCDLRGEYQLGPWEVRFSDPFGIFQVVLSYPPHETILVYPPVTSYSLLPLPQGSALGYAGAHTRSNQSTSVTRTVREYSPGDSFRHIHWPTTARRGALHTREFERETGGNVWILLDLDRRFHLERGAKSTLEVGVVLAASLALRLLEANRKVGFLCFGQTPVLVRPAASRERLWRILRGLALAQPGNDQPLGIVLAEAGRVVPTGSTLIVLTSSPDPSWVTGLARLRQKGMNSQVVLLAYGESRSHAAIRPILARMGVEAQVVDASQPIPVTPLTGGARRWEFKVLPTGRAVPVSRPERGGERWPG